jgi:hypothetical protein
VLLLVVVGPPSVPPPPSGSVVERLGPPDEHAVTVESSVAM